MCTLDTTLPRLASGSAPPFVMPAIDPIVHQPVRLRIMAALTALDQGDQVEFTYLRNLLDVTDGNLGAHLFKLETAGYIQVSKSFVKRKPKTHVTATTSGRAAYQEHIKALQDIIRNDPPDIRTSASA